MHLIITNFIAVSRNVLRETWGGKSKQRDADQVKLTLCLSRIASELAPLISINTQYY